MFPAIKSEFRKLLTIRSTYILTIFTLLLVSFLAVWVFGAQQASVKADNPIYMADALYNILGTFVTFAVIIAILHVAHEYRYSTINYTLTATRSRLTVLFSKTFVLLTYTTVFGFLTLLIAYFGTKIGLDIKNVTLSPQQLDLTSVAWQYLAYSWGYVLAGIILAVIIRSLVGSIVAFFLIPTAEGILSMLLKGDTKFLPFRSLDAIAATPNPVLTEALSHNAALGVFSAYALVFGALAVILFVRRDASS